MFLELTEETYERMRPVLFDMGVEFKASDCTLPTEKVRHLHLEFEDLRLEEAREIAKQVDVCSALSASSSLSKAKGGVNEEQR